VKRKLPHAGLESAKHYLKETFGMVTRPKQHEGLETIAIAQAYKVPHIEAPTRIMRQRRGGRPHT
jgi:hypothetical protein